MNSAVWLLRTIDLLEYQLPCVRHLATLSHSIWRTSKLEMRYVYIWPKLGLFRILFEQDFFASDTYAEATWFGGRLRWFRAIAIPTDGVILLGTSAPNSLSFVRIEIYYIHMASLTCPNRLYCNELRVQPCYFSQPPAIWCTCLSNPK